MKIMLTRLSNVLHSSRFYFLLYEVESPVKFRCARFARKYTEVQPKLSIEQFIDLDDKIRYNTEEYSLHNILAEQNHLIKRRFYNTSDDMLEFRKTLGKFNFRNPQLVRPSFDTYFMRMAELASSRSNCMKRGNGAVITKDNRVISTGYNGTPFNLPNCNEGGCKRCNDNVGQGIDLQNCICLHAEESAVIEAGRPRTMGATIYTTSFPCQLCTKKII